MSRTPQGNQDRKKEANFGTPRSQAARDGFLHKPRNPWIVEGLPGPEHVVAVQRVSNLIDSPETSLVHVFRLGSIDMAHIYGTHLWHNLQFSQDPSRSQS